MTKEEIIAMQFEEIQFLRMQIQLQKALEEEYKAEISYLQKEVGILFNQIEECTLENDELSTELCSLKSQVIEFFDADTRRPWEA